MQRDRGRITLPDVVLALASFAFLATFGTVFYDLFNQFVGEMRAGTALIWQAMIPLAVLVLFAVIFATAGEGIQ